MKACGELLHVTREKVYSDTMSMQDMGLYLSYPLQVSPDWGEITSLRRDVAAPPTLEWPAARG